MLFLSLVDPPPRSFMLLPYIRDLSSNKLSGEIEPLTAYFKSLENLCGLNDGDRALSIY